MSKELYIGVADKARKVKKAYIGIDGVARKITKAYIGVGGVARPFWSGEPFVVAYSGSRTVTTVTYGGVTYEQWTLTSSGVLSIVSGEAPAGCKVCVVGGGASGRPQEGSHSAGAGAFLKNQDVTITGNVAVTIGAGGANTSNGAAGGASAFGSVTASGGLAPGTINAASPASGTGAGVGGSVAQKGDGISKYPFGDTVTFSGRPHCGGGAAGVSSYPDYTVLGADGGTNGGSGGLPRDSGGTFIGGAYGGGGAGSAGGANNTGGNATFYGSGGGNGFYSWSGTSETSRQGGTGYQGVVYLRIPIS